MILLDSGAANKNSINFFMRRVGLECRWSRDPNEISSAELLIMPGVGHAEEIMKNLSQWALIPAIKNRTKPTMGICIGMQILFENLEEGECNGLGILPGTVTKLPSSENLRVPHMGWNRVQFSNDFQEDDFYFVHSFKAPSGPWVCADCEEGGVKIPAMIQKENFYGVQFHPERSGVAGEKFMKNFVSRFL